MRLHRVKGGLCRKVTCRLMPELDQEGAKEDGGESASGLGARDLGAAYLWGDHHLTCLVHSCPWISGLASGGSWPKAGDLSRSWSRPRFSHVWSRLLGLMVFFLFCHLWRLGLSGCRRAHRGGHRGAGPHTVASGGGHPAVQRPLESFCLQEPPHRSNQEICAGATLWWVDSDHLECQGGCNYHLFLHTKEVFNAKHPNRRVFTSGPLAGCGGLFLCGCEGDSQLPLKAERALTAPACSPPIAERAAPSVRANGDRDPGQVHLRGAAQGVHFGKKPGPGSSPLTLQNLSTFSFFMCGFS